MARDTLSVDPPRRPTATRVMSDRFLSRLAWSLCTLTLLMLASSLLLILLGSPIPLPQGLTPWRDQAVSVVGLIGAPIVGGLIASRRPRNAYGWVWLGYALGSALYQLATLSAAYGRAVEPGSLAAPLTVSHVLGLGGQLAFGLAPFLFLLFPTGRLPSKRWRPLAWISALSGSVVAVLVLLFNSPEKAGGVITIVATAAASMILISILLSVLSTVFRYRRASGMERQQLKWVALAAAPVGLFALGHLLWIDPLLPESLWNLLDVATITGLYIAVGIAVLKYRLYDLDLVVNRALVYGALTASVVAIYVLVVGYLGALFRTGGNLFVSLVATGLVAVLFQPLRERLQRGVNRLMHGERDEPYAVVSRLGQRLEATLSPDAVLDTITQTVREALKLSYVAVVLEKADGAPAEVAASAGKSVDEPLRLPLAYQNEPVGELLVGSRSPGEGFSAADRRLLDALARQAGIAAHAVRLTADLQRSRERLVTAREEERRRLRRDLHDGLGAQLAGLNIQTGALRRSIRRDPTAAEELTTELKTELQSAIGDIRRLVYDLRPPALDDLGLVTALRQLAERYGAENKDLRVTVEASEGAGLPPLPAAVEVAVYRVAQESLTNVVRHAQAKTCVVRLSTEDGANLEVVDDGVGIPSQRIAGVGLSSMQERAAELGGVCVVEPVPEGGTRVVLSLPLPSKEG